MRTRTTTLTARARIGLPLATLVAVACANYSSTGSSDDAGTSSTSASSTSSSSTSSGGTSASSASSTSSTSSSSGSTSDASTSGPCTSLADCDDKNACTDDACSPSGSCVHTPKALDDGMACTKDSCDPVTGVAHAAVTACNVQSDGCCPVGCTTANDPDCLSCTNLALSATPDSDSPADASPDYGPVNLNDGIITTNCTKYCWVETAQGTGASFYYTWPNAVKVASMRIVSNPQQMCGSGSHVLSGGTIETWDGNAWKTAMSYNNKQGTYVLDLPTPVLTTKVRITNTQVVGFNPQMYEWQIFNQTGCPGP